MYQWLIPGAVYLGKKDIADKYKDTENKQKNKCLHSMVQQNTFKLTKTNLFQRLRVTLAVNGKRQIEVKNLSEKIISR